LSGSENSEQTVIGHLLEGMASNIASCATAGPLRLAEAAARKARRPLTCADPQVGRGEKA
jgi:hypothetical protein